MFDSYLDEVLVMVLVTFIFTALLIPQMIKIAHHIGAMDIPTDNRRAHTKPIPKLGGLGIFFGFLFGYMLFGEHSIQMNSILIGSFIVIFTGLCDDINPISAKHKLLGHIAAALVIMFYGNILLTDITAFGYTINFGVFSYPITLFFIIACTNIINLIDGLDGLSSGISAIFFLTIGIIAFFQGRIHSLEITITFLMLGSTLGFLLHNFHPAKIFAGDEACFLGFMIAIISLLGFKGTLVTSFLVPILVLAIPILDTAFAILRRLLKGKPIFEADKDHLHHQFLKMQFSQTKTVLFIYFIDILFSITSILYALKSPQKAAIIYIVLLVLVIWFILHTSIISEKMSNKVKDFEHKKIEEIKMKKNTPKKGNQK